MNKKKKDLLLSFLFGGSLLTLRCFAHDEAVHEAITERVAQVSSGLSAFLTEQLGPQNAPFSLRPFLLFAANPPVGLSHSPIEWLKIGSREEDNPETRTKNHFYDPTKEPAIGLTDRLDAWGIPSFTWASIRGGGALAFPNDDSWQNARDYEWAALTNADRLSRQWHLAHVLYALGRVIHLNQDLTQPDHVRNDNHMTIPVTGWHPFGPSWIEPYGNANYATHPEWFALPPLERRGWLKWRAAGFTKLKDFWDRDKYAGNAGALVWDANSEPGEQLGLGEFSNGNFLGEDAIYAEFHQHDPEDPHYFPFPSLYTSTTYFQVRSRILSGDLYPSDYADGTSGNRVYLRKLADGVTGFRHSVLPYLITMRLDSQQSPKSLQWSYNEGRPQINDPNVLNDYHSRLIPKAIEYSAGILDYFFRGTLEVLNVAWDGAQYAITIRNQSGQELSGGAFTVLKDDANGNRTTVVSSTLAGKVGDNATWSFNFPGPKVTSATRFVVVYRGTIGLTGSNASDPVDAGVAIAAKNFLVQADPTASAPCDFGVDDNTVVGAVSIDPADAAATASWGNCDFGDYKIAYLNGAIELATEGGSAWLVNPPTASGPEGGLTQFSYQIGGFDDTRLLPYSNCSANSQDAAETGFDTTDPVCCSLAGDFAGPSGRETYPFSHQGGPISLFNHSSAAGWIQVGNGTPNPTWRLTRVRKLGVPLPSSLRIREFDSLVPALIPYQGATAGGAAPVWTGELPNFAWLAKFWGMSWHLSSDDQQLQLNGFALDWYATKVYHNTDTPMTDSGCGWVLGIDFDGPDYPLGWVGLGGNSSSPEGDYVFRTDLPGWTLPGKKDEVLAATTAALPVNHLGSNTLTADANGPLPAIGGVALILNDRVLVKDEAAAAKNGLYTVTSLGSADTPWSLTRSADADTSGEIVQGIFCRVATGSNAGSYFRLVTTGAIDLNATAQTWLAIPPVIHVEPSVPSP